jgi:hypothetical protein
MSRQYENFMEYRGGYTNDEVEQIKQSEIQAEQQFLDEKSRNNELLFNANFAKLNSFDDAQKIANILVNAVATGYIEVGRAFEFIKALEVIIENAKPKLTDLAINEIDSDRKDKIHGKFSSYSISQRISRDYTANQKIIRLERELKDEKKRADVANGTYIDIATGEELPASIMKVSKFLKINQNK